MEKMDKIVQLVTKGGIVSALIFIILYFGNSFIENMNAMQKDLAAIRLQITKVQGAILTPQQVEKMIDNKIKLLQYKFHSKECDTILK